jgi:hypothetical protein
LILIIKLKNVQIEAARIVTGGTRLISINSLYKETGWETLQARREHHKNIYFYKLVNGLVPPYLSAMVSCYFENIHDYNTRQAVSIPQIICNYFESNIFYIKHKITLFDLSSYTFRLNIFLRVISLTPCKMVSSLERVMDKTNKLSIICILEPCLNSEDNLA